MNVSQFQFPLCTIKIVGNKNDIMTDPIAPANSAHFCDGILRCKSEATQILREQKKKIEDEETKPLKAWKQTLLAVDRKGNALIRLVTRSVRVRIRTTEEGSILTSLTSELLHSKAVMAQAIYSMDNKRPWST